MNKKYVLQINRKYLWEDVVCYSSQFQAIAVVNKLRRDNPNLQCRIVEVFYIC